MTWFKDLMGFEDYRYKEVQEKLELEGTVIRSKINGRSFDAGRLETPSLAELRAELQLDKQPRSGRLILQEHVGDVQQVHKDNPGAVIQAASQFNLLEMVSPDDCPEDGVGEYEDDLTQGPACAIACGAGTIYRNYFVPVQGRVGQSASWQLDMLQDVGDLLNNKEHKYWNMRNGYSIISPGTIRELDKALKAMGEQEIEDLRSALRVGVQWDTEVTLNDKQDKVHQIYASSIPLSYIPINPKDAERFGQILMDASYEMAFCIALKNYIRTGNNKLFLTKLGSGAFGNPPHWAIAAISKAAEKFKDFPLEVSIVSYGESDMLVRTLVNLHEKYHAYLGK